MALTAGARIGPYEIKSLLGSGGMGEVYRARDTRLERDVALKVLPHNLIEDPERLRRFEQEARTAGSLNHPNVVSVYDVGKEDGNAYLVSELLEGETLRARLEEGALPSRKAIEYALQIAKGLAAAHQKGIVHRDLKPENLFITTDGHLKILDFGLAKLAHPELDLSGDSKMMTQERTAEGVLLGTPGYMSPEQVRGKQLDQRSDIFNFGAILYEMLHGRRAFAGDSVVERLNAILKEDPPALDSNPQISPGLSSFIRRCLEKRPEERFQSATDLGYALDALSQGSGTSPAVAVTSETAVSRNFSATTLLIACAAAAIAAFLLARVFAPAPAVSKTGRTTFNFQRLTFRKGNVLNARFAPDGKTVIYGASLEGNPTEIFSVNPGNPESRPLGFKNADIASVSRDGELAILLRTGSLRATRGLGTLARVPLNGGGAPRQLLENVQGADWTPDGKDLVVSHWTGTEWRIEFLSGKVIAHSEHPLFRPRISPDGQSVMFFKDNGSSSELFFWDSADGKVTQAPQNDYGDLAWASDSKHFYSTKQTNGGGHELVLMDRQGGQTSVITSTAGLPIHDVAPDGSLLLEQELTDQGILFKGADNQERNLSWLDGSSVNDFSADGNWILFTETADGGGPNGSVYLRKTDGSPATRLGDGLGSALSPDGKWVAALTRNAPSRLLLLPTGPGSSRTLTPPDLSVHGTLWNSDNLHIGLAATKKDGSIGYYIVDSQSGVMNQIKENEGKLEFVSPDFNLEIRLLNGRFTMNNDKTGEVTELRGLPGKASIIQFSSDLKSLYYFLHEEFPPNIYRYDIATSKTALWKAINLTDPSIIRVDDILITPDGKSYVYSFVRVLSSDLYLATSH